MKSGWKILLLFMIMKPEPIKAVRQVMIQALDECGHIDPQQLAAWHFEDECRDLGWERHVYTNRRYDDINEHETAAADPSPFFLRPKIDNGDRRVAYSRSACQSRRIKRLWRTSRSTGLYGYGGSPERPRLFTLCLARPDAGKTGTVRYCEASRSSKPIASTSSSADFLPAAL